MKLERVHNSPQAPPSRLLFYPLSDKNIIEHKSCRIRFYNGLYTSRISVFMNNKSEMYKFGIFEFSIILFSKLAILPYFDPK